MLYCVELPITSKSLVSGGSIGYAYRAPEDQRFAEDEVSSSEEAIVGNIPCDMIKVFADIKYTVTKMLLHLIRL